MLSIATVSEIKQASCRRYITSTDGIVAAERLQIGVDIWARAMSTNDAQPVDRGWSKSTVISWAGSCA
jgi:hypothetical protein